MTQIYYGLPGAEDLATALARKAGARSGGLEIRHFPDGEAYVRALTLPECEKVVLVANLARPDTGFLPLVFAADLMRDLGVTDVGLIVPYLPYMRQDKRFHDGEAVTSTSFARLMNGTFDWLITVDPHLHRRKDLAEIYTMPALALHAAPLIGKWISEHVRDALLIGPDGESEQWVRAVAAVADMPYIVLEKIRRGDRDVEVSVPDAEKWRDRTPVLVDDIISTARTMIETVGHLARAGMRPPICIGVHAVFAGDGYDALKASGVARIVTCNAIPHQTNGIDLGELLAEGIEKLLGTQV